MQCRNDRSRYHRTSNTFAPIATSHLVKHTANVITSSLRSSWVFMVVVHLGPTHAHARLLWWCGHAGRIGYPGRSGATRARHVGAMRRRDSLSVVHLGHSAHASTPQTRVLVAVPPAIDGSLNQPALASQARIQLRKSPAYCVALGLVVQTVSFVLVLVAARTRIDAVLRLEVLGQIVDADGLDVATDRVLHLHPVARVLERYPLYSVLVLSYHQGRSCRDGSGGSVGVNVRRRRRSIVHAGRTDRRSLGRCLGRAESRRRSL